MVSRADSFGGYHPLVGLVYFLFVAGFSMFFVHPVCLGITLFCAFGYLLCIKGLGALRYLTLMLPLLIITALLNPLLNHRGATILTYLPDGNPLTLESILYGIASAVMLIAVISWFACFNTVMTSDKFVYLFGRIMPSLSLLISMALRFVPLFKNQLKVITMAQKGMGRDMSGIQKKLKYSVKILSIMITWALENAIETADSMKGRGYGLPGRTAFSIFRFERRDAYALTYITICAITILIGTAMGGCYVRYFPSIKIEWAKTASTAVFTAYFALGALPLMINIKEDLIWKYIVSKT